MLQQSRRRCASSSTSARWMRIARGFTTESTPPPPAASITCVRTCVLAILEQHKALLQTLDSATYTFASPLLQASIGQHTRHSLDHLCKPVEALRDGDRSTDILIRYDVRARNTVIEHDLAAAIDQIDALQHSVRTLDDAVLQQPLQAAFMLSADGREVALASNLSRELAFAVHHCIHHNAMSKVLLRHHFPDVDVPPTFGMAPSTSNFHNSSSSQ